MSVTNPTQETVSIDDQLTDRETRALTEYMTVLDDQGVVKDAEGMFEVVTESGSSYVVDISDAEPHCTCGDHLHRGKNCKHINRVRFAIGLEALPMWIDADAIKGDLGAHVDGEPRVAMADGGVRSLHPPAESGKRTEAVDGGHLVWEDADVGRELVGFAAVEDWDAIRSELARRGLGVGAIHHLETFDSVEEVRDR